MKCYSLDGIAVCTVSLALWGAAPDSKPSASAAGRDDGQRSTAGQDSRTGGKVALYPLSEKNGPWMVKVKSFQGPEAIELANQLAQELRQEHKIPAYVLAQRAEKSQDIQPAGLRKGHVRRYDTAVVLAGDSANEKAANKLLEKVRKIRPKCITEDMVSKYHWSVGVLNTAYLIPNPLLPHAESTAIDPLVLKLNSGAHSLLNCPGEYSLQVKSFTGATTFGDDPLVAAEKKRLEQSGQGTTSMLEAAGEHAEQLAEQLRRKGMDAYVFHGPSSSVVCVGSFSSPDDPRILDMSKQVAGMRVAGFVLSFKPSITRVPQR